MDHIMEIENQKSQDATYTDDHTPKKHPHNAVYFEILISVKYTLSRFPLKGLKYFRGVLKTHCTEDPRGSSQIQQIKTEFTV